MMYKSIDKIIFVNHNRQITYNVVERTASRRRTVLFYFAGICGNDGESLKIRESKVVIISYYDDVDRKRRFREEETWKL